MIEEIHIFGVFIPAALAWASLAVLLTFLLRGLVSRLPVYRVLWHPALVELALFLLIWWGLSVLADAFLPRGANF